jgi:hypothetical protein
MRRVLSVEGAQQVLVFLDVVHDLMLEVLGDTDLLIAAIEYLVSGNRL